MLYQHVFFYYIWIINNYFEIYIHVYALDRSNTAPLLLKDKLRNVLNGLFYFTLYVIILENNSLEKVTCTTVVNPDFISKKERIKELLFKKVMFCGNDLAHLAVMPAHIPDGLVWSKQVSVWFRYHGEGMLASVAPLKNWYSKNAPNIWIHSENHLWRPTLLAWTLHLRSSSHSLAWLLYE